jgi:hypothetical protein
MWRVAANILKKQSWIAEKGWGSPPAWEFDEGLTTSYCKNQHVTKCYTVL